MFKRLKKKKRRKGFTLIELVLVITIIGILGVIVIPKFTGVAEEASGKADLISARTIESAVNLALLDNNKPEEDEINRYLSNIKVTVSNEGNDTGWHVQLLGGGEFNISKDGKPIRGEE